VELSETFTHQRFHARTSVCRNEAKQPKDWCRGIRGPCLQFCQIPTEVNKEIKLKIAYVLFMDIVGYSKLLTSEQRGLVELLSRIVRESEHFRAADAEGSLITVPTGDGMALVFLQHSGRPSAMRAGRQQRCSPPRAEAAHGNS